MSSYKLTYFNLTALGEPIRFLLHYGGIKFEDVRIEHEDWPKRKAEFPLGQLPVLEIDGKQYYQSTALYRYLGKKVKLAGTNELEELEIDAVGDTLVDLRLVLVKYFLNPDPVEKSSQKAETLEKLKYYLDKLEKRVADNGGHFVGGKLTWVDLVFASWIGWLSTMAEKEVLVGYLKLKGLVDKVTTLPKIKRYLEIRPKAKF